MNSAESRIAASGPAGEYPARIRTGFQPRLKVEWYTPFGNGNKVAAANGPGLRPAFLKLNHRFGFARNHENELLRLVITVTCVILSRSK